MDAASELAGILETVEATRGDVAELRHEMHREFTKVGGELDVIKARLDSCATKADLSSEMAKQTRWMLAVLVTLLVATYFKV